LLARHPAGQPLRSLKDAHDTRADRRVMSIAILAAIQKAFGATDRIPPNGRNAVEPPRRARTTPDLQ
jgi:hypothetical protein